MATRKWQPGAKHCGPPRTADIDPEQNPSSYLSPVRSCTPSESTHHRLDVGSLAGIGHPEVLGPATVYRRGRHRRSFPRFQWPFGDASDDPPGSIQAGVGRQFAVNQEQAHPRLAGGRDTGARKGPAPRCGSAERRVNLSGESCPLPIHRRAGRAAMNSARIMFRSLVRPANHCLYADRLRQGSCECSLFDWPLTTGGPAGRPAPRFPPLLWPGMNSRPQGRRFT